MLLREALADGAGPTSTEPALPPLRVPAHPSGGSKKPRRGGRAWRVALAIVLVPVAVGSLLLALLDPVAIVNRHLGRIETIAKERLGRTLTLGTIEGQMYPSLAVVIHGVQLSGDAEHEEPMLSLPRLELRFDLKRALLSFGEELQLESVRVDGGVLRIRRSADGSIDLVDVLKKLPPLNPADLEGGVLGELWIDGGNLVLIDEALGREIVVGAVHAETRGSAALGAPLDAFVTAQLHDLAAPLRLEVRVAEVPSDLVFWPPPPASARIDIPAVDLEGATAWLSLPPLFTSGNVDVIVEATSTAEAVRATLNVDGRGLSTVVTTGAGAGVESEGIDSVAHLAGSVLLDVATQRLTVESLALSGAGLDISGKAAFARPSLDGIESLDLLVTSEELARLGSIIPALRDTAPGALRLSGKGSARIQTNDERLQVALELDGARVRIGEALSKRAGERLRIRFDGVRDVRGEAPGRMDAVMTAELPHGVRIAGDVVVQPMGADYVAFDLRARPTSLRSAVAVSPLLRDLVDGNTRGGTLGASLRGHTGAMGSAFDLRLRGRDVTIVVDKSTLAGDANIALGIATDARGLRLDVNGDLRGMSMVTMDDKGKALFEKHAGSALAVRASLVEAGGAGSLGNALAGLDDDSEHAGKLFVGDGLSPRWRAILLGLAARGTVSAEHVTLAGLALDDATLRATMDRGRIRIERSDVALLAGRGSLAGTVIDLRASPPTWGLVVNVDDIDLATLLAPLRTATGEVKGTITMGALLRGAGLSIESVLASLDGPLTVTTHNVSLGAVDFFSGLADSAWDLLARVPGVRAADVEQARGPSLAATLADGTWTMRFKANQLRIDTPIVVETTMGALNFDGHATLDSSIAFLARLDLEMGDDVTVPVELGVRGTWAEPEVTHVNVDVLLDSLGKRFVDPIVDPIRAAAAKLQEGVREQVDKTQRDVDKALGRSRDP
jgi:hypothetical protein